MVSVEQWRAAPRVRRSRPRCSSHVMLVCIAPLSACCHLDQPNYLCNCRLVLHAVPCGRQRTLAHAPCHSSCTCCTQRWFLMGCIPPWATLARCTTLSKLYSSCAPCTSAAVSWRLGTARPNVQHGAGAPHGHFSPMRRSTRVLCAHGRLSAREELQDISRTPETRPMPHLLRIPPPLFP